MQVGLFYTHFYNGFFNLTVYMGTPEINTYRYKSFFLNIHVIVHSKNVPELLNYSPINGHPGFVSLLQTILK